ncbi:hypothetical protein R1flu_014445 [Riccia fluitans]|uniref:Uncharacterized protein n=1 Tax=Riccia fluitans TaxID=41844 RepID=A0ABD1YH78_9MARC
MLGADFKEGLKTFAEVYRQIEQVKVENTRELEMQKMRLQQEIEKDRRQSDLARQELEITVQMKLAEMLSKKKRKRSSRSDHSFSGSDYNSSECFAHFLNIRFKKLFSVSLARVLLAPHAEVALDLDPLLSHGAPLHDAGVVK